MLPRITAAALDKYEQGSPMMSPSTDIDRESVKPPCSLCSRFPLLRAWLTDWLM